MHKNHLRKFSTLGFTNFWCILFENSKFPPKSSKNSTRRISSYQHQYKNSQSEENDSRVAILKKKNPLNQYQYNRISYHHQYNSHRRMATSTSISYSYEVIKDIADYLLQRTSVRPVIGIICGSGLSSLADNITDTQSFAYEDIPNFPVSTVEGHVGRLIFGYLEGLPVMAMQGRFHYYEGYPLAKCSMPVRVMKLVGVRFLMATNAAGGLNPKYKVGDIMIVRDHINMMGFAGNSPLQGPNDPRFGPRFPPMANAYDAHVINTARKVAKEMGIESEVHEGVYTCLGGPNYETVAELKMLHIMGVDAVGMSTVHEVITARHCDLTVFAFSLITNKCALEYTDSKEQANHEEVVSVGKNRQAVCRELLCRVLKEIGKEFNLPTKQ